MTSTFPPRRSGLADARPGRLWDVGLCGIRGLFGFHLARGFVFTQSLESGLTHEAISSPAGKLDFGDQLRLQPDDARTPSLGR